MDITEGAGRKEVFPEVSNMVISGFMANIVL